jgi:hypothetical protein
MACDPGGRQTLLLTTLGTLRVFVLIGRIIHPDFIVGIHKEFLMTNLSQRGILLFGVMLAVCGLVPSLASAASWSAVGTTHQLFSSNFEVTVHSGAFGHNGWRCNAVEFDVDVFSANTIEVTRGNIQNCHGTFNALNCTLTEAPTGFPWTATATSTTNVQVHGIDVDVLYENTPGNPNACPAIGAKVRWTGTLTGGSWNAASNDLSLVTEPGVTAHSIVPAGPSSQTTTSGTFVDTANTLRVFD